MADREWRSAKAAGRIPLLLRSFDHDRLTALRHAVAECAGSVGLRDDALEDFVLAVNELVTNAVRHGGGRGRLELWRVDDNLVCEVTDNGAGLLDAGAAGQRPSDLSVAGGLGLWLTSQLAKSMTVETGPEGTTVRITAPIAHDAG
jgi:anti-sigma regulatory factor (Ser/Thr protein kinase)